MNEEVLSFRYAKALLSIAQEKGMVERLREELAIFTDLLSCQVELNKNLSHPAVGLEAKLDLIDRISEGFGFSREMKQFLFILLRRRRLSFIGEILESYRDEAWSLEEKLKVLVETPFALTSQEEILLRNRLSEIFKKAVQLEIAIDKSLIGGIKVKVGHLLYDGSLKWRLNFIREALGRSF